ncbi:MAG: rhodanese-like domain-containing protein [Bacteroidota bacterium]
MKKLNIIAIVLVSLGLIIAFVPKESVKPSKLSEKQLITELKEKSFYISSDDVAKMIIEKDPTLKLVDVRDAAEFQKFSLENATNISISEITSDEQAEFMNQDKNMIVLFSNGNTEAVEAWMLCRQKGYENIYVLQGGMNNWYETILNPIKPSTNATDDELAKYDFRRAASTALGGGTSDSTQTTAIPAPATSSPKPAACPTKKKKGASGGCG